MPQITVKTEYTTEPAPSWQVGPDRPDLTILIMTQRVYVDGVHSFTITDFIEQYTYNVLKHDGPPEWVARPHRKIEPIFYDGMSIAEMAELLIDYGGERGVRFESAQEN